MVSSVFVLGGNTTGLHSQLESEYIPMCACAYKCIYTYSIYNQAEQLGVNISVAKAVARRAWASLAFAGPAAQLPVLPQEGPCSPRLFAQV